jgi:heme oxygenase
MTASASVRTALRVATQNLHADVERHLNLGRPHWTASSYLRVLERFWGFYFPLETLLTAIDWEHSGIAFSARRKISWLEQDLAYLGKEPDSIRRLDTCCELPSLDNLAAGMGALYVIEGATLGGQLILRTLRPQLGLSPASGGRFFASYGGDVGAMWRSYLSALETQGRVPQAAETITRSAVETFAAFERWVRDRDALGDNESSNSDV